MLITTANIETAVEKLIDRGNELTHLAQIQKGAGRVKMALQTVLGALALAREISEQNRKEEMND